MEKKEPPPDVRWAHSLEELVHEHLSPGHRYSYCSADGYLPVPASCWANCLRPRNLSRSCWNNGVILLVLIGFIYQRIDMFVDIAIVYALLNFMMVIVLSRYFERGGEKPE